MAGDQLRLLRRDSKFMLTDPKGFTEDIVLKSPSGDKTLNITGFASKHWMNFDTTGAPVNTKNAHISIVESYLVERGWIVRNDKGEVTLLNCTVSFPDSSGVQRSYVVRENYPDETLGFVFLVLADYKI